MDKEKARSIMQYMYTLYSCAKNQDCIVFHQYDYKWYLGFNIVSCLVENGYFLKQFAEMSTVFGITIELDFKNPDKIELWKNITNDV